MSTLGNSGFLPFGAHELMPINVTCSRNLHCKILLASLETRKRRGHWLVIVFDEKLLMISLQKHDKTLCTSLQVSNLYLFGWLLLFPYSSYSNWLSRRCLVAQPRIYSLAYVAANEVELDFSPIPSRIRHSHARTASWNKAHERKIPSARLTDSSQFHYREMLTFKCKLY